MWATFVRHGAPLFGTLPVSGVGEPLPRRSEPDPVLPAGGSAEHNAALLDSLELDVFADELLRCSIEDAAHSRMSPPVSADRVDLNSIRLHPRFGVEQGVRQVRMVDVLVISLVDGCICQAGRLSENTAGG